MTDRPKTVRPLTISDEENLFNLLCMAYKENAPYTMSESKVKLTIAAAARDREVVVGVIDAPDGTIAASVGGIFCTWWYTDDLHLEEFWSFVHPNYRRSTHAKDLINYMKWVAENMDMPLHMGILTSTRMEAKIRLYQRQMPQVGAAFAHNMKTGNGPIAGEIGNG